MKYTVIGYYADNGQSYIEWVKAEDAQQAFGKVANMAPTFGGDLVLVACVPGHKVAEVPCPDAAELDTCAAIDFPAYTEGRCRRLTKEEKGFVDRNAGNDPQQVAYGEGLPVSSVVKYMKRLEVAL